MLNGYKTYILAGLTVIGAIAHFLIGDATVPDTINLIVTALMGAFIRHGIETSTIVRR